MTMSAELAQSLLVESKRRRSGQAMLELAIVMPILVCLIFAIIDFARAFNDEQMLVDLTRQGSNMALRGADLTTTANVLVQNSNTLNLAQSGEVIVTSIARVNNADQVTGQVTKGALSFSSKIGTGVGAKATVPTAIDDILIKNQGQTLYVTEVYYTFQQLTPVSNMWQIAVPSTLYQVTYF